MRRGRYDDPVERLAAAAARRLWAARLALAWERLWPALWPATMVAGGYLALALFDPWSVVPGWLHAGLLAATAIAVVGLMVRGLKGFRWPDEAAALRRIEVASGLAHRPLGTLRDHPVSSGDARLVKRLWAAHLERLARGVRRLRIGTPAPGLARRDPWGLRGALVVVLAVGLVVAGGEAPQRLARAFTPTLVGAAAGPAELTLWISPPAYTQAAPVYLAAGTTETAGPSVAPATVTVPAGSEVVARLHGGRDLPSLYLGETATPFTRVGAADFEIRGKLTGGRTLAVVQDGADVGRWPLSVIPDQPPKVAFTKPPSRTRRAALRLDYAAEDDYGIVKAEAVIRRDDASGESFTVPLSLPAAARSVEETSYHDLTPHPWAGLPVRLHITVSDAIGQTGSTEEIAMILPERVFNHPVARELIELRKLLALDFAGNRDEVGARLDALSRRPDHFFNDTTTFLAMRAARAQLRYDHSKAVKGELQKLLWDLALGIEEGPLALAEQDLRAARDKLMAALDRGAPDAEIERLIDQLMAAVDRFLDALAKTARQQRDLTPSLEEQMAKAVRRDEIMGLVERMRELSRAGSRDAARQLLSQLQDMLENLRAGKMAGGSQDRQRSAGEKALRALESLVGRQQNLLDQTFRWAQGGKGQRAGPSAQGGAARQEALRRALGELMLQWGDTGIPIPRSLGRAERAMRESTRALGQGLPGQAVAPQSRAVDEMQQGGQAMLQELVQRLRQGPRGNGSNFGMYSRDRDPLGRPLQGRGYQDDGRTHVPDKAELQRSHQILQELYRRANQPRRPILERNYLRRLLRRF